MDSEYVIYVIDSETTGLDPLKHEIIELSACRFHLSDADNRDQKTWLLRALDPTTITDEALAVNKHKKSDILHLTKYGQDNYQEPAKAIVDIETWIMQDGVAAVDRVFAGQNPMFDINMMLSLWKRMNSLDTFPFSEADRGNRVIDTKQLALLADLCTGKRRQFYNLSSLVKSFGVKTAKAHTAEGDVKMTTDLLVNILQKSQKGLAAQFESCYTEKYIDITG